MMHAARPRAATAHAAASPTTPPPITATSIVGSLIARAGGNGPAKA